MQVWVKDTDEANLTALARVLDQQVTVHRAKEFQAFVIWVTAKPKQAGALMSKIAKNYRLTKVHLATLKPDNDAVSEFKMRFTGGVKNTAIVYRERTVTANLVNVSEAADRFQGLRDAISKATR